jgi:PucR family transcriptional regulator, purine catabolism regulatory protein
MQKFTIKKLLESSRLNHLRLVRGHERIDNEIHNVNIIDNPDSYEWFSAGDFLLTTGYIFKDKPELQKQLIKELSDLNCSGLGIKIKRYWDTIPKTILDEAKKRNFPIVEIPFNYGLAQVSNIINDEIFGRESSDFKRFKDIYDAFAKITLDGGDLAEIALLSSQLINNSVIIIDSRFNLLTYHDHKDNKDALEKHIELTLNRPTFPSEITDTLPVDASKLPLSIKRSFKLNNHEVILRFMPSIYSNTLYGYIVAWETTQKLQRLDYIALETAARTLALERIKSRQLEESRLRQKNDLFDDLITGKFVTSQVATSVAEMYGINTKKSHLAFVIKLTDVHIDILKDMTNILDDASLKSRRNIHITIRAGNVIGIIELWNSETQVTPTDSIKRLFELIIHQLTTRFPNIDFIIGVSNPEADFNLIGKQISLTFDLLKLPQHLTEPTRLMYYHDYSSYHLLTHSLSQDKLLDFFHDHLGKLYEYDQSHKSDLMNTLNVYYESNTHIEKTAQAMFIHRNTILYRLEKIQKILHVTFDKNEPNFNLQLALKIFQVLQLSPNLLPKSKK